MCVYVCMYVCLLCVHGPVVFVDNTSCYCLQSSDIGFSSVCLQIVI